MAHEPEPIDFRWQAFFQRSREPFFLLNRQRRFLFVNHAWETLTGLSAPEARGAKCPRRARPGEPRDIAIRAACCPPPEALAGRPAHVRRLVDTEAQPQPQWWHIDFLPLTDENGLLCVLGKITLPDVASTLALTELHAASTSRSSQTKPWRPDVLMTLRQRHGSRFSVDGLSSSLPAMRRVAEQVRLAGATRVPILIAGEPGAGKEWLARAIHAHGPASEQTFVCLDCARLPAAAVAEALFPEAAPAWRSGVGTFYLKNPASLPRDLQTRVIDLLQGPARIIAGCGPEPSAEVHSGRLVTDLYCALATVTIELPPLRDRLADLPLLLGQMLERLQEDDERRVEGPSAEAWEVLRAYRWPGNLRELLSVLAAARRHSKGAHLEVADLPAPLRLAVGLGEMPGPAPERSLPLDKLLEEAERKLLLLALRRAQGNKSRAAELLSIWRPRLLRRMEVLGIADLSDSSGESAET